MKRIEHSIKAEKIDAKYQRIMDMEVQHWRETLKRILLVIKLLVFCVTT